MKSHVYKPLLVVLGIVVLVLAVRMVYVPRDFGIGDRGYMYGWHRHANEQDWKNFKVKYQGREYCKDCHSDNYTKIMKTPHRIIQCENCHGPAIGHPDDPPRLVIDKSRALCLRCHFPLPYASSGRSEIKSIDPLNHNPDVECSRCHNPHNPMEGLG
jgi:predicted CXXCH cytochrome family protein